MAATGSCSQPADTKNQFKSKQTIKVYNVSLTMIGHGVDVSLDLMDALY